MNWPEALRAHTRPLPGSTPYEQLRPIRVRERFDGWPLLRFLSTSCPFASHDEWLEIVARERLLNNDQPARVDAIVRSGQVYVHVLPDMVEPDVNVDIRVLHDDDAILVVSKPAPLPVHPSGRFNKNSLVSILEGACPGLRLRVVHRLDSDTTGCIVFARSREAANELRRQFEACIPEKRYLARVSPPPGQDSFACEDRISRDPGPGGSRCVDPSGLEARTAFSTLSRFADGSALVEAAPETGRTHQIRVHLAQLGSPVVGDELYGPGGEGPLCLHAKSLRVRHPETGEEITFSTDPPPWA